MALRDCVINPGTLATVRDAELNDRIMSGKPRFGWSQERLELKLVSAWIQACWKGCSAA